MSGGFVGSRHVGNGFIGRLFRKFLEPFANEGYFRHDTLVLAAASAPTNLTAPTSVTAQAAASVVELILDQDEAPLVEDAPSDVLVDSAASEAIKP